MTNPTDGGLAALLRHGSRAEHVAAEQSPFMADLLAGRLPARGYADYLACLRRVYATLEDVGRSLAGDPVVDAVLDPALERSAALAADAEHWGATDGASPATDAYVARVEAARSSPVRYLAHHYTRYLGDLSGGRAVGRVLRRTYGLTGEGLAFYDFPEVPRPRPYKDGYRARLDALDLTEGQRFDALAEVTIAFGLNRRLLEERAAGVADG